MNRRVLCVDDDENILRAFERNLRLHFEIETAVGPTRGLAAVQERGPYAVVVSDLRMPEMDGIQFLAAVRKLAPDSVRLILSGNADFQAVVAAVNEENIFRLLTKPCPPDKVRAAIDAALKQYRLITAERELLEVTLNGCIGMMTELLGVVSPLAFGASTRIRRYVRHMATHLCLPGLWEFDAAAMLSQIGCAGVPSDISEKHYAGAPLTDEEKETFASHPLVGYKLLTGIPRLEAIAEIIRYQMTPFREIRAMNLPEIAATGAQMLMVAQEFDAIVSQGASASSALRLMTERPDIWQPKLVNAMESLDAGVDAEVCMVRLRDLRSGMILNQNIRTANGLLLVADGQILSETVIAMLLNSHFAGWDGSFSVRVPVSRPMIPELSPMPAASQWSTQ